MSLNRLSYLILLLIIGLQAHGQSGTLAKVIVDPGQYDRENSIVGIHLDDYQLNLENSTFALVELSGKETRPINSQLDLSKGAILWWVEGFN